MEYPVISLNPERKVSLTCCFHPEAGRRRPAVLVLPGGGYQECSSREAENVAEAFVAAGCHGFVLRYSLGKDAAWPNPLTDYEQAMELIRGNAEKWGVIPDKIAVIGFSAGGHLASAAAVMGKNRPNAALLGYAVTGAAVKLCSPTAPDTAAKVDRETCPCFLFATRTDDLVPVQNSLRFAAALAEAGVAFESHIYSFGPHGFSLCTPEEFEIGKNVSARVPDWLADSIGWLKELFGDWETGELPVCGAHFNGNAGEYLSVDCTIGHLMKYPAVAEKLGPMVSAALTPLTEAGGMRPDQAPDAVKDYPLRRALSDEGLSPAQIEQWDQQLRTIPNKR